MKIYSGYPRFSKGCLVQKPGPGGQQTERNVNTDICMGDWPIPSSGNDENSMNFVGPHCINIAVTRQCIVFISIH